jgi:antitoxin (DNA-binding transcriptional repressor) of toxin-antitoxin stability system
MKRYTSSEARQNLAAVLDAAERGEPVIIERGQVRFVLRAERTDAAPARRRRRPLLEIVDPAVAEGAWTWKWDPSGLTFASRRPR